MLTNQEINELIGVTESYKASDKLIKLLFNDSEKEKVFDNFLKKENDLNYDWFVNYFQEEHSDRAKLKQDFTPKEISKILNSILNISNSNGDICAGTGSLTIARWAENKDSFFYCEEYSDRTVPFLLFNLAIRNTEAIVWHGDSLSRECKNVYKISKSDKYGIIEKMEEVEIKCDKIVMNPPYSLKWEHKDEYKMQERFSIFGVLPPKSKADYAFIMQGLNTLEKNGEMAIILPHGVLFRGAAEGAIRKKIIELNLLDSVIGLPDKIFLNTAIPTTILILKKNKTNSDILFIDASKQFVKSGSHNIMQEEHINKILEVYFKRMSIDKFSSLVTLEQIEENDFNLNIPRYVDTFESQEIESFDDVLKNLKEINTDIKKQKKLIAEMTSQLTANNDNDMKCLKEFKELLENMR